MVPVMASGELVVLGSRMGIVARSQRPILALAVE
jgi:hypothetical protein